MGNGEWRMNLKRTSRRTRHSERSEESRYMTIMRHMLINTSRRERVVKRSLNLTAPPGLRVVVSPLDTPFGREGSEGSKGSKGGGIALRAMSFIAAPRLPPTGGIYNSLSEPARPAGGTGDAQGPQARRRLEPGRRKAPEPSCFREYSFSPIAPLSEANTTLLYNLPRSGAPFLHSGILYV